jgi:Rad3-related DNA helicase
MKKTKKQIFDKRKLVTSELLFESILDDYTLRESQIKTMEWFKDSIEKGKKFFICNLPVGSGKSLLSQLIIKFYLSNVKSDARFDLLTCSKNLQNQYLESFPYLNNLWGKSNYNCEKHSNNCEYGKVCNSNKGESCEDCPHSKAFERWQEGKISLTNFHIHGLYSMFMPKIIEDRKSNMLIVDEAHILEQTVNSFISFNISKKQWCKFVSNDISAKWENDVFDLNTVDELSNWIKNEYVPALEKSISYNSGTMKMKKGKELEKLISLINELTGLKNSIDNFIVSYDSKTSEWVVDKKNVKGVLSWDIQPLWTNNILKENIWKKYSHVVLMSGTIIDPVMFCEINGIDIEEAAYIKLNMNFPKTNRPIYYLPVGKMTFSNKQKCWEDMKPYIEKTMKKYQGKKGIILCNYEILEWIRRDFSKEKRFIYVLPENRQESIDKHLSSDTDTVLVSASLYQGIDLKDDLSRFQVFLKIPYPSLASKINKMRMEKRRGWYEMMTIIDLIQGYGRSIRSDTDYADTLIFDSCLSDILVKAEHMIPSYYKSAIQKIDLK